MLDPAGMGLAPVVPAGVPMGRPPGARMVRAREGWKVTRATTRANLVVVAPYAGRAPDGHPWRSPAGLMLDQADARPGGDGARPDGACYLADGAAPGARMDRARERGKSYPCNYPCKSGVI